MTSLQRYMGGGREIALSADLALRPVFQYQRVFSVSASSAGFKILLPGLLNKFLRPGYPQALFINVGSNSFSLAHSTGSPTYATVSAGECAELYLLEKQDRSREWGVAIRPVL